MTNTTIVPATPRFAPPFLPNLPLAHQGKSRDTYWLPDPELRLVVATDRVSTHDFVHEGLVREKGKILTAFTIFWHLRLQGIRTHVIAWGADIYAYLPGSRDDYPPDLQLYAIVVRWLPSIRPIEFIFRGRLNGSIYKKFYSKGLPNPYGIVLPPGLGRMTRFVQPIFTPTDKTDDGDPPRNSAEVKALYPRETALGFEVFRQMNAYCIPRGVEASDTKLEIAEGDEEDIAADEIGTPDSTRYIRSDTREGEEHPHYMDKEPVRIYVEGVCPGEKRSIKLPDHILDATTARYHEATERITGSTLSLLQRKLRIA